MGRSATAKKNLSNKHSTFTIHMKYWAFCAERSELASTVLLYLQQDQLGIFGFAGPTVFPNTRELRKATQ